MMLGLIYNFLNSVDIYVYYMNTKATDNFLLSFTCFLEQIYFTKA